MSCRNVIGPDDDEHGTGTIAEDSFGDAAEEKPPRRSRPATSHDHELGATSCRFRGQRCCGESFDSDECHPLAQPRAVRGTGVPLFDLVSEPAPCVTKGWLVIDRRVVPSILSRGRQSSGDVASVELRGVHDVHYDSFSGHSLGDEAGPVEHRACELRLIQADEQSRRCAQWHLCREEHRHGGAAKHPLRRRTKTSPQARARRQPFDDDEVGTVLSRDARDLLVGLADPDFGPYETGCDRAHHLAKADFCSDARRLDESIGGRVASLEKAWWRGHMNDVHENQFGARREMACDPGSRLDRVE